MPHPNGIDALLPPDIAEKAEAVGVAKSKLALVPLLTLAVLAGAFIAMGAVFSTAVMTGSSALPWGVGRLLGGLTFCLGLILVVVGGAELFTGNALIVMAVVSRKVSPTMLLRNWAVAYAGNFIGAFLSAAIIFCTSHHTMADGQVGLMQLKLADAKCGLTLLEAVTRGIYCNALVCLAIWLCLSCRTTGDKIMAIVFPITAFVAAGFEHCIANMYAVPVALFVKAGAGPEFWTLIGSSPEAWPRLTWGNFMLKNLLSVTLGNIIGGVVFVGLTYWLVYRRPSAAAAQLDSGPTGGAPLDDSDIEPGR